MFKFCYLLNFTLLNLGPFALEFDHMELMEHWQFSLDLVNLVQHLRRLAGSSVEASP